METPIERLVWDALKATDPGKEALIWQNPNTGITESWSYGRLIAETRHLAESLLRDASATEFVFIFAGKGPRTYAVLLASLLSGKTFVPLSPTTPSARLAEICSRFPGSILFCDSLTHETVRRSGATISRISDLSANVDEGSESKSNWEPPRIDPSTIAYIIHTSGSTGQPKPIMVTRRNLEAFLASSRVLWDFRPEDRISQIYELSFDPALSDVFWCFTNGATLVPFETLNIYGFGSFLRDVRPTVIGCAPSYLEVALKSGAINSQDRFDSVRFTAFIGEKLRWSLADAWSEIAPRTVIENHYGPAETTISVSRFTIVDKGRRDGSVPIGKAHPNQRIELLDSHRKITSNEGEIAISGPQVGPGYYGDRNATEERFVQLEWDRTGATWYLTGDIACRLPSGDLEFDRRLDHQVKIKGVRTELSEVQSRLERIAPESNVLAVFLTPLSADDNEPTSGSGTIAAVGMRVDPTKIKKIRSQLAQLIQASAVPSEFYWVERPPLNPNGKIDRKALLKMIVSGACSRLWPE